MGADVQENRAPVQLGDVLLGRYRVEHVHLLGLFGLLLAACNELPGNEPGIPLETVCSDEALSDGEADVDCGGVCPTACEDGKHCLIDPDCVSQACQSVDEVLTCVTPPCGDLTVTGIETCDDGNTMDGDGCSATCQAEDGYTCAGAGPCVYIGDCQDCPGGMPCVNTPGSFTCVCDPGFAWDGTKCVPGCGDGDLQPPEGCDDGNVNSGDGCTANCTKEPGYVCMGEGPGSCIYISPCGTMADTCLDTETCVNTPGSFTCECTNSGTDVCNDVCIDVTKDVFNCGACDNVCLPSQSCLNGSCM